MTSSNATTTRMHGTAVAIGQRAALIRGPSGAGKSDLALRFLGLEQGAAGLPPQLLRLVADDQVLLRREGDRILAAAPAVLRGRLEVRGVGIVAVPSLDTAELALIVDLSAPEDIPRLPEPAHCDVLYADCHVSQELTFIDDTAAQ